MERVEEEQSTTMDRKLLISTKRAYALGHIFNDIVAAMWFSYTLIYLQKVALLKPLTAGVLLLLGQVVDALMTPVFGILVDRYNKKKLWHVVGSIMVTFSFPYIFGGFIDILNPVGMSLYTLSIILFQTGWAAVQISHLSMIPLLTGSLLVRTDLTAIRYSAQVVAAILVFFVTWIILPSRETSVVELTPGDSYKFRNIGLVLTGIGLITTILFHILLKSHHLEISSSNRTDVEESTGLLDYIQYQRRSWVRISLLLRVALLYVASRLFITLATIYLPLYIEEINVAGKENLATAPLVSYISSFAAATLLKYLNKSCGNQFCYLLGIFIGLFAAVVTELGGNSLGTLYVISILIGAASSITIITALSVTAELIGSRTERSAVVYSVVTFLDKVVTGLVVIFIENWRCTDKQLCLHYNRDALALICSSSMILGLITLLSIPR